MAKKRKPEKLPEMSEGMCVCEHVTDGRGLSCVCDFTPKEARKMQARVYDMTLFEKPGIWEKK